MKKKLILIGAGGFAKSVVDSLDYTAYEIAGFIDTYKTGTHQGFDILSNSLDDLPNRDSYVYFIAIGEPIVRSQWFEQIRSFDLEQINVIDHSAIISRSANLGDGIYIGKMCLVNCDSTLADGVVINTRSLIEHGNSIGYCTNISTNVVLNGDVNVGTLTFVGSCTVVNGQLTLGSNSVIGSGSVVIRDIPNNVVVAGSPTRLIRKINNE
ncbi:MAG: acetyltransferase [Moritella sp.]|uniref:acetyltransferase n=1 Tax=Moritella sp. TaxID=78556 RepID=UPI0025D7E982|nr:acetyltransferase [Moritella sp.]NQZ94179.1 acetyltransferase [Moritella sp.]